MQLLTGACLVIMAANTNASTLVPMEILGVSVMMDTTLPLTIGHVKVCQQDLLNLLSDPQDI